MSLNFFFISAGLLTVIVLRIPQSLRGTGKINFSLQLSDALIKIYDG
jgi:hypothetical protein